VTLTCYLLSLLSHDLPDALTADAEVLVQSHLRAADKLAALQQIPHGDADLV